MFNQLYNTKSLLVIDDEKYFCFAGDNELGNSGYYTTIKETSCKQLQLRKCSLCKKREISEKINNVEKTFAASDRDMSEPLFRISTAVAFNTSIYINECLEKQLLPFIHKYHGELTIYCGQI